MKACYFLFVAVILSLAACYTPRYVYSPVAQNVPVFEKKGEVKLSAAISTNVSLGNNSGSEIKENRSTGADIQAAWAFSTSFALQGSFSQRNERNSGDYNSLYLDSSVIRYQRNIYEIGVGYYSPLTLSNRKSFQVFGGFGIGTFKFSDNGRDAGNVYYYRYHNAKVFRVYLQPAYTLRAGKFFTTSLSSRFNFLFFQKIHSNYTNNELENYKLYRLDNKVFTFWEPATINRFGFNKLPGFQIELQLGLAFLLSRQFVDYRASNISLGLILNPYYLKKKDKSASGK